MPEIRLNTPEIVLKFGLSMPGNGLSRPENEIKFGPNTPEKGLNTLKWTIILKFSSYLNKRWAFSKISFCY